MRIPMKPKRNEKKEDLDIEKGAHGNQTCNAIERNGLGFEDRDSNNQTCYALQV